MIEKVTDHASAKESLATRLRKAGYDKILYKLIEYVATLGVDKGYIEFKKIMRKIENNDPDSLIKYYNKKAVYADPRFDIDKIHEHLAVVSACHSFFTYEGKKQEIGSVIYDKTKPKYAPNLDKAVDKVEQQITQQVAFDKTLGQMNELPPLPLTPKNNTTTEESGLWQERKVTPPKTPKLNGDVVTPETTNSNSNSSSRDPSPEKRPKNLAERKFTIGNIRVSDKHSLERFGLTHDFEQKNNASQTSRKKIDRNDEAVEKPPVIKPKK